MLQLNCMNDLWCFIRRFLVVKVLKIGHEAMWAEMGEPERVGFGNPLVPPLI